MVDLEELRVNEDESDKVNTFAEHLLPPVLTYVVRKAVLGLVLVLLFTARKLSRVYGFHFEATVSDRVEWCWGLKDRLPRYHARVEKVD